MIGSSELSEAVSFGFRPTVNEKTGAFLNDIREDAQRDNPHHPHVVLKSKCETIRDLHLEFVMMLGKGELWSLAQYELHESGDLIRDPDIGLVRFETGAWFPWSYRNDFTHVDIEFVEVDENLRPLRVQLKEINQCREIVERMIATLGPYYRGGVPQPAA